jgi:uncharacterized protein
MYNLAMLYEYGWGVAEDYAKAYRLYKEAADKGEARAMMRLGVLYRYGLGRVVTKDAGKARSWLERAAAAGEPEAMRELSRLARPPPRINH